MNKKKNKNSALKVNDGISQPSSVNDDAVSEYKLKGKSLLSADEYMKGILNGDRVILSKSITLIESNLPEHHKLAQQITDKCLPYSGNSIRIGITGVPGVGKSTFIEALGKYVTNIGRSLAVLAIDPSSKRTKGSILGDKTRMEELSTDKNAFIRPSPTAGSLGGVTRKTRETVILCEAAGFNTIFIETVGVGQSETLVHSMVDFFLLLMLAGAGDELQGIKRGIMEMADAIFINKADEDNIQKAKYAKNEYTRALHLFPPTESGWIPVVDTCSSVTKKGIDNVWNTIIRYLRFVQKNGFFEQKRNEQEKYVMYKTINQRLMDNFYQNKNIQKILSETEKKLIEHKATPYTAAKELIDIYFKSVK